MLCGLGFRVQGLGFRVQGSGFRVWGADVDGGGEGEARTLCVGRHTCAEYRSGACRRQGRRSRPCACSLATGIACSSDDTLLVQGLGFKV